MTSLLCEEIHASIVTACPLPMYPVRVLPIYPVCTESLAGVSSRRGGAVTCGGRGAGGDQTNGGRRGAVLGQRKTLQIRALVARPERYRTVVGQCKDAEPGTPQVSPSLIADSAPRRLTADRSAT